MADEEFDDLTYPQEEIERFVHETVEQVLTNKTWDEVLVP